MSLHSFEASACCWENIARVYVWEVAVEDSNHDRARRTMLFQVSKNCNSVWSLASPTPVFPLIRTWQRCVTYKEFPGTGRELIQHRVHVCVLLLDFHFQTEGADKVWRLLWKTNRWRPRLSKTLEIHFPRGSLCLNRTIDPPSVYLNIDLKVFTQARRGYSRRLCQRALVVFSEEAPWGGSCRLQVSVQGQGVGYIWNR